MLELNRTYNMDCMEGMAQFPDKFFDVAVVDPPYGDAGGELKGGNGTRFGGRFDQYKKCTENAQRGTKRTGGGWAKKYGKKVIGWDYAPSPEYFKELFRVSKEQIVWGGNYFALPPNRCFICWRKTNIPEKFTMAMVEYAWCSFNDNAKLVECSSTRKGECYHPTQKPVELYDWIFKNYTKPGQKVLDTHLGSGSSRIAAYEAGLEFIGFEIDPDYFSAAEQRFALHTSQMSLFHL